MIGSSWNCRLCGVTLQRDLALIFIRKYLFEVHYSMCCAHHSSHPRDIVCHVLLK